MYKVVKTYGHDLGLSCTFRQWRAKSHCRFLHGYALAFEFTFAAEELDSRGWVIDFGALKELRDELVNQFDHTTVVAADDPDFLEFRRMEVAGLLDLRMVDDVGCEAFALWAHSKASQLLAPLGDRVRCASVRVSEHGANSAVYCARLPTCWTL